MSPHGLSTLATAVHGGRLTGNNKNTAGLTKIRVRNLKVEVGMQVVWQEFWGWAVPPTLAGHLKTRMAKCAGPRCTP